MTSFVTTDGVDRANVFDPNTIDLPIIDFAELSRETGKQVLDAFVSTTFPPTA